MDKMYVIDEVYTGQDSFLGNAAHQAFQAIAESSDCRQWDTQSTEDWMPYQAG